MVAFITKLLRALQEIQTDLTFPSKTYLLQTYSKNVLNELPKLRSNLCLQRHKCQLGRWGTLSVLVWSINNCLTEWLRVTSSAILWINMHFFTVKWPYSLNLIFHISRYASQRNMNGLNAWNKTEFWLRADKNGHTLYTNSWHNGKPLRWLTSKPLAKGYHKTDEWCVWGGQQCLD